MPVLPPSDNPWLTPSEPGPPDDPPCHMRKSIGHAVGVGPDGKWIFAPGPGPRLATKREGK